MSPLGYDPSEKQETGPAQPGSYTFSVASAEEVEFRSGNQGLKIQLDVDTGGKQPKTVYENFVYVPQALWRLDAFLVSIGLDFENPPDEEELIGCTGVAYFKLGEPNDQGRRYLEADEFKAQGAKPLGADKKTPGNMPPGQAKTRQPASATPLDDDPDDIPF